MSYEDAPVDPLIVTSTEVVSSQLPSPPSGGCKAQLLESAAANRIGKPESYDMNPCATCNGEVLVSNDAVSIPDCTKTVKNQCEEEWLRDRLLQPAGEYAISATVASKATSLACASCVCVFTLDYDDSGTLRSYQKVGDCQIDVAGNIFNSPGEGTDLLDNTHLAYDPEREMEQFDGEPERRPVLCSAEDMLVKAANGTPVEPGIYECPLSIMSGEHCLQRLRQHPDGNVTGEECDDWRIGCVLLNPSSQHCQDMQ